MCVDDKLFNNLESWYKYPVFIDSKRVARFAYAL